MMYRGRDISAVEELVIYGKRSLTNTGLTAMPIEPSVPSGTPWLAAEKALSRGFCDQATADLISRVERALERVPGPALAVLSFAVIGRGEEWWDERRHQLCLDTAQMFADREWWAFWAGVLPEKFGLAIAHLNGQRLINESLKVYREIRESLG